MHLGPPCSLAHPTRAQLPPRIQRWLLASLRHPLLILPLRRGRHARRTLHDRHRRPIDFPRLYMVPGLASSIILALGGPRQHQRNPRPSSSHDLSRQPPRHQCAQSFRSALTKLAYLVARQTRLHLWRLLHRRLLRRRKRPPPYRRSAIRQQQQVMAARSARPKVAHLPDRPSAPARRPQHQHLQLCRQRLLRHRVHLTLPSRIGLSWSHAL